MAVLMSRKLIIATLVIKGDFPAIQEVHTHEFARNAYNFYIGTFGQKGEITTCVQSVDGAIFFIQKDRQIFQIQLPDYLIPGPMAHFSTTDCLVITNSNFEIESYRYNSLQAFTTNNIN